MMRPIFITGTGTGVGKTIISAIVAEALQADYWKPVQAGFEEGTDSLLVRRLTSDQITVYPELYKLRMPASPHIAAPAEGVRISIKDIISNLPPVKNQLVIEGAGGLMVPLNETEFIPELILKLNARVIIVSKNELGSINHSMLTAAFLKQKNIEVAGWIFSCNYKNYEDEIVNWSGYPKIASVKYLPEISKEIIKIQAIQIKPDLQSVL